MHEEALLRDVLRKVEEVARADPHARIVRARVWVGALSHFSESGLRNRWPTATRGTVAEGSEVEVRVSTDPHDPRAGELVLENVTLADPDSGPGPLESSRFRGDPPSP
jgi:hydrogenase nickel incorporation protein HypA/HybF